MRVEARVERVGFRLDNVSGDVVAVALVVLLVLMIVHRKGRRGRGRQRRGWGHCEGWRCVARLFVRVVRAREAMSMREVVVRTRVRVRVRGLEGRGRGGRGREGEGVGVVELVGGSGRGGVVREDDRGGRGSVRGFELILGNTQRGGQLVYVLDPTLSQVLLCCCVVFIIRSCTTSSTVSGQVGFLWSEMRERRCERERERVLCCMVWLKGDDFRFFFRLVRCQK